MQMLSLAKANTQKDLILLNYLCCLPRIQSDLKTLPQKRTTIISLVIHRQCFMALALKVQQRNEDERKS